MTLPVATTCLKWGLVGYGDLAHKRLAAALREASGSVLPWIWGRIPEKAQSFAAEHGIAQIADSFQQLLDSDIDAVYICTPPDSHSELAISAITAGKHVLVEKPMAATVADAERMVAAAHEHGVTLGIAYYRRTHPKMQRVKQLLDDGTIGVTTWVNIAVHSWFNPAHGDPKAWRVERNRSGGAGALADVGVHRLDLLDYWLGAARVVYRDLHRLVHSYDVEDGASLVLKLVNGAPVHAYFAWNSRSWMDRFEIVGSAGKIIADPLDGDVLTVVHGREREEIIIPSPANPHVPCIENFIRAIHEERAPSCDGHAGLRTNRLLAAILSP